MPQPAQKGSSVRLTINGEDIDEVESGEYSSDALAVPDFCTVTIDNQDRKYNRKLLLGQTADLYMSNPAVNGGAWTLRFHGVIVKRAPQGRAGIGSTITLTIADLGWHLLGSAPLWFNIKRAKDLPALITALIDPSFGFKGVRGSNLNHSLKQGIAYIRSQATPTAYAPLFAIQVEAGDDYLSLITQYARRDNKLVNVSVDGYIQLWVPDYTTAPEYVIRNGTSDANTKSYAVNEDADKIFTNVECVGEQLFSDLVVDPNDPNAGKKRGGITHTGALPFLRRLTFSDPEMYQKGLAQKAAEWKYKRSLFDAWVGVYTVPEHYQVNAKGQGQWWESDCIVDLQDNETSTSGRMYLRSVLCRFSKTEDDTTEVTLHQPGLLTANIDRSTNLAGPTVGSNQITGTPVAENS